MTKREPGFEPLKINFRIADVSDPDPNFQGGWMPHKHPKGEICWHAPEDVVDGILWVRPSK